VTRTLPFALGLALAAAPLADPLAAQQPGDSVVLNPIVVTATRLPTLLEATTSAATVITGAELRARGVATVAEALRGVPGVDVLETGPFGGVTSLFLRGGESDYVRVLVDGVPINAPGGAVDLSTLTTADVARIEIVRGPASVLYGSDAVTGVIQIFTRDGSAGGWSAEAGGGTFGERTGDARLASGGSRASLGIEWSRFADDGIYAFNNAFRNDVVAGTLTLTPDGRTSAKLAARYDDNVYHYPTDGSGNVVYHNQYQAAREAVASLDVGRFLTPWLEARALLGGSVGRTNVDQEPNTPADTLGYYAFRSYDRLGRRSADARLNVHAAGSTVVTAGAVFETETETSNSLSLSQYGPSPGSLVVSRWNRAAYLQALSDPGGRLALNAGLRVERNQAFGGFFTYRGGAAWRLGATRLRASLGTSFKEPSFFENYSTGYVLGNPALKPERSASWDAGIERSLGGGAVVVSATWFSQRFRNLIQYTSAPPVPTDPNYYNIAAAVASGLELQARAAVGPSLDLDAQYTYTHTEAQDSGYDGAAYAQSQRLLRRPTHSGSMGATARPGAGWSASATAYYVGNRLDENFATYPATRVILPAYVRVDLAGEAPLVRGRRGGGVSPAVALTLKVENLLDERYEQVLNFPSRRRAVFVGLRLGGGL